MTNLTDKTLAADAKIATANASGGYYRGWKKTETYSVSGIILHELYFQNLGNNSVPPEDKFLQLTQKYFGGFDAWRQDFTACATAARGWCILVYEQRTATFRNILLDLHDEGNIATSYPILVLDMYEHAYFLDYATDKAAYIKRFLDSVPWDVIERRVEIVM